MQDFQVGLALASPALITPQVTPAVVPMIRPNLTNITPSAIADLQWPPVVGSYDPNGMTSQPGDMTVLSLALSYEEVRAFILGLTQSTPPQSTTKTQIYNAASGLVQALAYMGSTKPLTIAEYATIWLMLFRGHLALGPGSPPLSIRTLRRRCRRSRLRCIHGSDHAARQARDSRLPYEHQNTDRASKWRIVVTGTLPAGTHRHVQVRHGFTLNNKPFQPAVTISDGIIRRYELAARQVHHRVPVQFQNETVDLTIAVTGETSHELRRAGESHDGRSRARFLAEVADELKSQLDALKARVDDLLRRQSVTPGSAGDAKVGAPGGIRHEGALASVSAWDSLRFSEVNPMRKLAIASLVFLGCYRTQCHNRLRWVSLRSAGRSCRAIGCSQWPDMTAYRAVRTALYQPILVPMPQAVRAPSQGQARQPMPKWVDKFRHGARH